MKKDVLQLSIKLGCIFILVTVLFAVTYYENAELARELLGAFLEPAESNSGDGATPGFIAIWRNNLFACVKIVAMGMVPVIQLPLLTLLSNGIVIGSLFGLTAAEAQMNLTDAILYSVVPHGVFEFPAMFLSFGLGFYLCRFITGKFFRREDQRGLLEVMNGVAKGFVLGAIPLITIAALIECYVTPQIMGWGGLV